MFQHLRAGLPIPQAVNDLQQALKDASPDEAANLWKRFLREADELVVRNNRDKDKYYIEEQQAALRNRILDTAGIGREFVLTDVVKKADEARLERDNKMAERAEEFERSWRAIKQNIKEMGELWKGVELTAFVKVGETLSATALGITRAVTGLNDLFDIKGKFFKFFTPPTPQTMDTVHGLTEFADRAAKGAAAAAPGPAGSGTDLGQQLGIDAPILKKKNRYPSAFDIFKQSAEPMRFAGGGDDALGYPWNQMRKSTNIEDRRRIVDDGNDLREQNSRLLKQVNEKLFLALQGEPSTLVFGPANVRTGPGSGSPGSSPGGSVGGSRGGNVGGGATSGGGRGGGANPPGAGTPATGSLAERIRVAKAAAMEQLRAEGVPAANVEEAANLMVGQALAESGLNPNTSHDNKSGYGIYGARDGRGSYRRTAMLNWLKEHGYAHNDLGGQMKQMVHSAMTDGYGATKRILMNADPRQRAANTPVITKNFENPARVNYRTGHVNQAAGVSVTEPTAQPQSAAPSQPAVPAQPPVPGQPAVPSTPIIRGGTGDETIMVPARTTVSSRS